MFLIACLCVPGLSLAQWQPNGIPVCDTSANSGFYMLPQIASDGNGGAFVCWRDARRGELDIYMQHIYADGTMQFPHNGIPLCVAPSSQDFPRMVSDDNGGAYVAWEDSRTVTNSFVYVQRIKQDGSTAWQPDGIELSATPGLFISIASEPSSGASLLGWIHYTGVGESDVFVEHLDTLGNRVWVDSGVQVTNREGSIRAGDVAITPDDSGGMIVVWAEGTSANYEVYAQRVDGSGSARWTPNGVLLGAGGGVTACSVGDGGTIVSWIDSQTTYIQKLNNIGQPEWRSGGLLVGPGGGRNFADGCGGAFAWHANSAQRFSETGTLLWEASGVYFTTARFPTNVIGVRDRLSGMWMFWSSGDSSLNVFGQYVDADGTRQWDSVGILVSGGSQSQDYPRAVSDGSGHAIVVWDDFRNGHSNVYAGRVDTSGLITSVSDEGNWLLTPSATLEQNYPNPFNPETAISFSLLRTTFVTLKVYDLLGREVKTLVQAELTAGRHELLFSGEKISSGIYFYRLATGQTTIVRKMILVR